MAARSALLIFLTAITTTLAASGAYATCYCACNTATGGSCTVSVPDYACHRSGTSLCAGPLERCAYDCSRKVERPPSCNPRRRCSVRG
jgi:hypothetical protein